MNDTEVRRPPRARAPRLPWLLLLFAVAALAAVLYFGRELLAEHQARAEAAWAESNKASAALRELESAKKGLEERVQALEEEKADVVSERNELAQEVRQKESEISKLKATYDALEDKMKAEIKKGEIRLSQAGGRIRVDMVDKILFDSGQASLSARGSEVLGRLGAILAKIEDRQIQVSGHTDDSPISERLVDTFPTNWELSVARAVNVVRFLSDKASVPAKRLVAAGYGQFHPIASNATHAGRARNRRIEILLTPSLDAQPAQLRDAAKRPTKR